MKKYIITVLAVAILGGIVTSLISNKRSSIKKNINFIVGLITAIVLITPIINLIGNITTIKNELIILVDNVTDSDKISSSNTIIINTTAERMEESIKKAVIKKYGFKDSDVSVKVVLDTENIEAIEITDVQITLKNEASWSDTELVKKYVEDLIGVKTIVTRS